MSQSQEKNAQSSHEGPQILAELSNFLGQGGSLKMLKGVSNDTMESLYFSAYNLYQAGKYEDSMKLFQGLCMLDHYQEKYFLGLGACRQQLKQYSEALEAFSYAALLNLDDPRAPLHGGECNLMLDRLHEAEMGFKTARDIAGTKIEHQATKRKAEQLLAHITIRKQEQSS